jgi:uncharacterized membrane protein
MRLKVTSIVILVMFIVSGLWLALVVVAPYLVPANTLTDLSGSVSVRDNEDQFENLGALPKTIYSIGDVECHQIASRSYFLNGNEMPFCARDLGLFIGLAAGFGIVTFYRYKINPFIALLGLVPIGVDGGLQLVTGYESNNVLRLSTGIVAGVAMVLLIALYVFLLSEDRKSAAKEKRSEDAGTERDE